MEQHTKSTGSTCEGGCAHCSKWAQASECAATSGLVGWRFAAAAAWLFIFPLVPAIAGSLLLPMAWASEHSAFAGAVGGLLAGVAVAAGVHRIFGSRGRAK